MPRKLPRGIVPRPGEDGRTTRGRIQRESIAFRVWRAGQRLNWNCTARELAEIVGCSAQTINKVCREREWTLLVNDAQDRSLMPVDLAMRETDLRAIA